MRVLHVIDTLEIGGAEKLVTGLSAALVRSGSNVEIYALRGGGALEAEAGEGGIVLHRGGLGSVYSLVHVFRLAQLLRSRTFDIIHVHLYPAQLWVCLATQFSRCKTPVVTTEHSTSNKRRTIIFRWLDRWMYRRFAAVAAISEATREALGAHVGDLTPSIRVVHNGIDVARFESASRIGRNPGTTALVILSIGSLTRVKDQATIIRAMAGIVGARLVLAGDGPLRKELESLACRLGVQSRVEFLGVRNDIPRLIADSDIYVQASLWEGFCLAAAEAMCGGLPCIVARNSGLEEVVGQAGLYFEPGRVDELAAAIEILSGDPDRRAALAARGVEQAGRFSLRACCAGYDDFYRDAMQRFSQSTHNGTCDLQTR